MSHTQDGSELLTGPGAGGLLRSAVGNSGGVLHSWQLDHVDHRPGRSTKALYRTMVAWPELDGPQAPAREELFGASAHIGEREKNLYVAEQTLVMTDGDINVRVWRYPHDPWLPMLPLVCYPDVVGRTLHDLGVTLGPDPTTPIAIDVVSYRPGRRAVLRASQDGHAVFLKVMQPHRSEEIVDRHQRLLAAGVPVPAVIAHHNGLVVLEELPGRPLARAVIDEGVAACTAEDLVALLDRLPASMYTVQLRPPWTDSVDFYAGIVSSSVPALGPRLDALVRTIRDGLAALEQRMDMRPHDVVHGDFYEAQVFVSGGKVVGVLDIDTVGPGRRADDLACLLAHLSVLADYGNAGRIDRAMQERVEEAIRTWHTTFADRVDPTELALRSAGVVLSLATGPHRQQEASWEAATEAIVRVAEEWVGLARTAESRRLTTQQQASPAGTPVRPSAMSAPSGPAPQGTTSAQGPTSTQGPTSARHAPPAGSSAPAQQPLQQPSPPQAPPQQHAPPMQAPQQQAPQQQAPQQQTPQQHAPQQALQQVADQRTHQQPPARQLYDTQPHPTEPGSTQAPRSAQAPTLAPQDPPTTWPEDSPPQSPPSTQPVPIPRSGDSGDDSPTQERRIDSTQPH
ncbi:phosphotransferase [Brachybacterium sp. 107]|uniref:phosphotransferase n=1 Tax=Brachybacterium sp. 107 TaxID=3457736 RepID=UPI0040344505